MDPTIAVALIGAIALIFTGGVTPIVLVRLNSATTASTSAVDACDELRRGLRRERRHRKLAEAREDNCLAALEWQVDRNGVLEDALGIPRSPRPPALDRAKELAAESMRLRLLDPPDEPDEEDDAP